MGKINEITAPSVSGELGDTKINDVTLNPAMFNPKSFDLRPSQLRLPSRPQRQYPNSINNPGLRPNELRKRARPHSTARRRLTPPFPG